MKIKEKICEKCGLHKSCGNLPGFCSLTYLVPIIVVVVVWAYLLTTLSW